MQTLEPVSLTRPQFSSGKGLASFHLQRAFSIERILPDVETHEYPDDPEYSQHS